MGDGCVEEAASPMSHPERQRDFFHLALRVENQGQLFSSHPSELGHRTNPCHAQGCHEYHHCIQKAEAGGS